VTDETGAAAAGWYADPMRRYEHRYYNGRAWTADVATGGRRFVDQLGTTPTPPFTAPGDGGPDGPPTASNPMATAGMVLGIVAVSIAWMPLVVVLGVIAAVLGLVFGAIGLRRSRRRGVGRSFAIAGLVTSLAALGAAVLGVVLTIAVVDEYDAYLEPEPHEVVVTGCQLRGSRAVMTGELTNTGTDDAGYSVRVGFVRPGTDNAERKERVEVGEVRPGATVEFEAQAQVVLDEVDCLILEVNGPLPFGVPVD
jgi:hypothetical protein